MSSVYCSAQLAVPADVAWDYLDKFTRSEVQPFSDATAVRDGEYRVVTMHGMTVRERNVTIDPVHRRTTYTIAGLEGVEHHQGELRLDEAKDGTVTLIWVTDYLPQGKAEERAAGYQALFTEFIANINAHTVS